MDRSVILVVSATVIAGYVYVYAPSSTPSELTMHAEEGGGLQRNVGVMILCPSKAKEMGLCSVDERDLHAKYSVIVKPSPPLGAEITCQLFKESMLEPRIWAPKIIPVTQAIPPPVDSTGSFKCNVTPQGEGKYRVDLAFVADPNDAGRIGPYMLIITIGYDEPYLPWMPLLTRSINGTGEGDLCVLGYHQGSHPPFLGRAEVPESDDPLGWSSCGSALFLQGIVMRGCSGDYPSPCVAPNPQLAEFEGTYIEADGTLRCPIEDPSCMRGGVILFYLISNTGAKYRLLFMQVIPADIANGTRVHIKGAFVQPSRWPSECYDPTYVFDGDICVQEITAK
jgi:hypothetical protein